jgi:acetylornithine deacetylase/succinyl-diaminopimelate desuccinylase-like protein
LKILRVGLGDTPSRYLTLEGLPAAPASFGSDAPHLSNFTHRAICGPGSIRHAHRSDEQITLQELETAVAQYKQMYKKLI